MNWPRRTETIDFLRFHCWPDGSVVAIVRQRWNNEECAIDRASTEMRLANLRAGGHPHDGTQRILEMWPKDEAP